ncbi:MAG: DUF6785 family protein [Candidatus Poribacteria bacterium]
MPIKVLLIAIFLIPINSLWMMTASLWNAGYPTTVSLFFNVIFYMFIIIVINKLIELVSPKKSLTRKELALLYPILTIAASINGLDMLQLIGAVIAGPNFLATPENEWKELFIKHIPNWLMVSDKSALDQYAKGDSSFFIMRNIQAWFIPAILWSAFTVSLILVMLGLTLALSSRWVSEEKLSYPIIQLPLHITESGFLKDRFMWMGAGIGLFMGALNGLHFFFPNVPTIGRPVDIGRYFTEKPLNAIGWLPIAVQPFAIGLGFFMPVDLSFSCWFFYLFWKFERVITSMLGINIAGFPFINEQTTGAYVAFALVAVWVARKHIVKIFQFRESSEKNIHSFALITLFIGLAGITAFCLKAGMGIKAIIIFFVIYFLISISIGRIRAELGSPVHDLHFAGPDMMMVHLLGTRRIRQEDLTIISMFWYFNRAYRSHPMPCILEGVKLGERTGVPATKVASAVIFSAILATIFAFIMHLQSGYRHGAWGRLWPAYETYNRLSSWLTTPTGGDFRYISAYSFGALFVVALTIFRTHFIWFPLHPVGFVVSSSWGMNPFWFSVFLSWLIKYSILKYGGLKVYRRNIPLFLGLILGEFIADAGVSIAGTFLKVNTYIWYG